MDRREFIKTLGAGAAAAAAASFLSPARLFAQTTFPDLTLTIGEPAAAFDMGIKALGGMGRFVKKGQRVCIKPNIGWNKLPDEGANTNPLLVKRIIEHCFNAGAREVVVFDNTCDTWQSCYKNSGIEAASKEAGAKVMPAYSSNYFQKVEVNGQRLKTPLVHTAILESDVFINVPVLKNHGSFPITACMKNLMGIVYDRGFFHTNDLARCIAEINAYRKPDLNVLDAYLVMKRGGPRGYSKSDLVLTRQQVISTDVLAADAGGAAIFGADISRIGYMNVGKTLGLGESDLTKLRIERLRA